MKEMIFLVFLLVLLGAPNFILCDLHPPEEEKPEQLFVTSNSIEGMQNVQSLALIDCKVLETEAISVAKGINTSAFGSEIQQAKNEAHEREQRALQRVLDKTIDNWNLSFGLSH